MEPTDSTNITCPSCGHGIDSHRPDEDAIIDACWAVAVPATEGDPEGLCECSLRPSEIAGGLLDHAREGIPALVAEVERLRTQLTITDEMVKRGALAMHQITCDTNWHECSHAGPAGCMAIARQVLSAALAFDPPTVLALLDAVDRLSGQLDNPRDVRDDA